MLTQEQIASYHKKGYLGVEGVLDAGEVEALRQTTDEFVEQSRTATESDTVFDLEPGHAPDNPKLRRLKSPVAQHEIYSSTLHHERILDIVAELIGPRLRTNGDKLNMKSGEFGSPVEWASGLGFLPAHQRRPARRGRVHRRHERDQRLLARHPRVAQGADLQSPPRRPFRRCRDHSGFRRLRSRKDRASSRRHLHPPRPRPARLPAQYLAPSASAPTLAVLRRRLLALGASARLGGLLPDLCARRAEPAHPRRRRAREHADARSQSRRLHLRYPDRIAPLDLWIGKSRAAHLALRP